MNRFGPICCLHCHAASDQRSDARKSGRETLGGGREFLLAEDAVFVVERQDEGFHRQFVTTHLAQMLEAVVEEIGVGFSKR